MNTIETKLKELLHDRVRLGYLLRDEKARRGVAEDALVFIGCANVAEVWWCAEQAVLKSRARELEFFAAYLEDRISFAHRLGLISQCPTSDDGLLNVGSQITLDDIAKLLEDGARRPGGGRGTLVYEDRVDEQGVRIRVINPA